MQEKELSINRTIIFNILSVILIQGISFFTSPIFSRLLGTDNFGVYSTFNAWVNILVIVLPLCVNSTIALSLNEYADSERASYQSSTYTLGILCILVFSVIILVAKPLYAKYLKMSIPMILCMLFSTLFSYTCIFGNTRYIYNLQANKNFFVALINVIATVIISLILINSMPKESNYWGRILGGLASSSLLSLYLAYNIYKEGKVLLKVEYIKFCLPLSIPVVFHSLSNVILNQSDRIMIQGMCSNSMAGVYSLAYNFATIMTSVYAALNNSWTPFYFRYLNEKDTSRLHKYSNNYTVLYSMITIGFLMVFKEAYSIFADERYWEGMRIIPILIIGLFFMYLYSFAINYEFYLKKTKGMAIITSSAAILNLILNYALINRWFIIGAAIATAISYAYEFLIHYIYVLKISNGDYPFKIIFYFRPFFLLGLGLILFYTCDGLPIVRWTIALMDGIFIVLSIYKRKSIF